MTRFHKITATPFLEIQGHQKELPGILEHQLLDLMHTFFNIPKTLVEGAHRIPGRAVNKDPLLEKIVIDMTQLFTKYINQESLSQSEIAAIKQQISEFTFDNTHQYLGAIRSFIRTIIPPIFEDAKNPSLTQEAIIKLPRSKQMMVFILVQYLINFAEFKSSTLMTEENLAMIFSATIQPPSDSMPTDKFQKNCKKLNEELIHLLEGNTVEFKKFLNMDFGVQLPTHAIAEISPTNPPVGRGTEEDKRKIAAFNSLWGIFQIIQTPNTEKIASKHSTVL